MKRFYMIAIAIAITCLLALSIPAQQMVLKSQSITTIDGVKYDTLEVEPFGFNVPIKFIALIHPDAEPSEDLLKKLGKDSPIIKDAMEACFAYKCSVFEMMCIPGDSKEIQTSTSDFIATTKDKERTTRLTIKVPKIE